MVESICRVSQWLRGHVCVRLPSSLPLGRLRVDSVPWHLHPCAAVESSSPVLLFLAPHGVCLLCCRMCAAFLPCALVRDEVLRMQARPVAS